MQRERAITGSLLGIAIGDALGLPYENLSPARGRALLGEPDRFHFFFGRGMVSDDTELSNAAAQSLLAAAGNGERFRDDYAARVRAWLWSFPLGGGRATYTAAIRLSLGWSAETSGTFSAGNLPALPAVVLGAAIDDLESLRIHVIAMTRVTHTDPQAEWGALTVALLVRMARDSWPLRGATFLEELSTFLPPDATREFVPAIEEAIASADRGQSTSEFAQSKGWSYGVAGYILPTVSASLQAAFRHPTDFREAVRGVIRCGGDADSTAAITGGILGAALGKEAIPSDWLAGMWEPQRSLAWLEELAAALAERRSPPPELSYFPLLGRNLIFSAVVLYHIFRRWLPPYW